MIVQADIGYGLVDYHLLYYTPRRVTRINVGYISRGKGREEEKTSRSQVRLQTQCRHCRLPTAPVSGSFHFSFHNSVPLPHSLLSLTREIVKLSRFIAIIYSARHAG
jgi:hypothetical protein